MFIWAKVGIAIVFSLKKGIKKPLSPENKIGYTRFCGYSTVLEQTMVFIHICIQIKSDHRQPDVAYFLQLLEYHIRTSTTTTVHDLTSHSYCFLVLFASNDLFIITYFFEKHNLFLFRVLRGKTPTDMMKRESMIGRCFYDK